MPDQNLQAPTLVERPTPLGEKTLVGVLLVLCLFAIILTASLSFGNWPATAADARIHFLGWGLLIAVGGVLLLVAAFASPFIGTVRASGLGANLEIDGIDHEPG